MDDLEATIREATAEARRLFLDETIRRAEELVTNPPDDPLNYSVVLNRFRVLYTAAAQNGQEPDHELIQKVVAEAAKFGELYRLALGVEQLHSEPIVIEIPKPLQLLIASISLPDDKPPSLYTYVELGHEGLTPDQVGEVIKHPLTIVVGRNPRGASVYYVPDDVFAFVATSIPRFPRVHYRKSDVDPTLLYLAEGIEERLYDENLIERGTGLLSFREIGKQYNHSERVEVKDVEAILHTNIKALWLRRHNFVEFFKYKDEVGYYAEDIMFLRLVFYLGENDFSQRKVYQPHEIAGIFHRPQDAIDCLVRQEYFEPGSGRKQVTQVRSRFRHAYDLVIEALKRRLTVAQMYGQPVAPS